MKWFLLGIMVIATVVSDLLQSYHMKRAGGQSMGARGLLRTVARNGYLVLSIACLAFSFFSFMALVQSEPLSFAVPASAAGFILETALARIALKEQLGFRRYAGAFLVLIGVVLIGQ
ncbi:MAG: EamA family transporter [Bryobacteraceae bacterium]